MNTATFDITALLRGLMDADATVRDAAERGMGRAGSRLLNDASTKTPTVPKLKGDLRGSGSVSVNGKHMQGQDNGATASVKAGEIVVEVGFNTPYAAYQHEGVRMDGSHAVHFYTTDGSGKKFLETPLLKNSEDYIGVAAAEIRKVVGP